MTIEELLKILEMQEEILQFTHFTNEDAWELGNIILAEARRRGTPVTLTIRLGSGQIIFQAAGKDASLYEEELAEKKVNSVIYTNQSTLRLHMLLRQNEENLSDMGMDSSMYAGIGGGFPIRIEEVGVIGAIAAVGENHVTDHDLLVKSIGKYLHVDEVPRIRGIF